MLRTLSKGKFYHTKSHDHTAPSPFPAAPPLSQSVWDSGNPSFPWGHQRECGQAVGRAIPYPLHGGWIRLGECWGRGMVITGFFRGSSLVVQSLRLCTPNVGTAGLIPGQGTKIPHVAGHSQKKKKKAGFFGFPWGPASRVQSGGWEDFASNVSLLPQPTSLPPAKASSHKSGEYFMPSWWGWEGVGGSWPRVTAGNRIGHSALLLWCW